MIPISADSPVFRVQKSCCPNCNKSMDAATGIDSTDSRAPAPDDITICIGCATILQFDTNLQLVLANPKDLETLPYDTLKQLTLSQEAIRARLKFLTGMVISK